MQWPDVIQTIARQYGTTLSDGEQSDEDRYVKCDVPDGDDDVAQVVYKVQKRKHSARCRRNGRCRFHYPRPPSPHTLIAREIMPDTCSETKLKKLSWKLEWFLRTKTPQMIYLKRNCLTKRMSPWTHTFKDCQSDLVARALL